MEVTQDFLVDLGGWDVLKQARSMLARGTVLNSDWKEPVLKGMVQEGPIAYRAGLVIKSARDVENLCTCFQSRQRSIFCAHSIAVGLHHIKSTKPVGSSTTTPVNPSSTAGQTKPLAPTKKLKRAVATDGQQAQIHVIFPPNFEEALAKGRLTIYFEGSWKV